MTAQRNPQNLVQGLNGGMPIADKGETAKAPVWWRRHWRGLLLAVVAVAVIALIVWLKGQVRPVTPDPAPPASAKAASPTPPQPDLEALVHVAMQKADDRNKAAQHNFERELERVLKAYKPKLDEAGEHAAEDASGYRACCGLIGRLAWDQVRKTTTAEAYLDAQLRPAMEAQLKPVLKELNLALADYQRDLEESSNKLAKDLAALVSKTPNPDKLTLALASGANFQKSLRNLGLNGAVTSVSLALDLGAILNAVVWKALWEELQKSSGRIFKKAIAKTVGSLIAASADGPFPFGDVAAVGGAAWTAYDIHHGRQQFEEELQTSLKNMVRNTIVKMEKAAQAEEKQLDKHFRGQQQNMSATIV